MILQDILDELDKEILPEPTPEEEEEDANGPTITIVLYESK